jgi:hypothetical protein
MDVPLLGTFHSQSRNPRCVVNDSPFNDETLSDLNTQSVLHSKQSALVIKTYRLKLYTGIIAVCSEIHTKYKKCSVG